MTFENFYFSKIFQKTIKLAFNFCANKILKRVLKIIINSFRISIKEKL